MELTWITFPLLSLLFCGLAYGIAQMTRPSEIQVNQLEIVDVDASTGFVRGTNWSNLYSPNSGNCDINLECTPELGFAFDSSLISWQGLPGDGLGGMQTSVGSGVNSLSYQLVTKVDGDNKLNSQLESVPLYVSSTKALFGQWNGKCQKKIQSVLSVSSLSLSPRLEGTITNPFDFPIKNVRVLFDNNAYSLNQDSINPGETIDILSETKERTVRSLLARKTKKKKDDNKSSNSPWNPRDSRVSRIADMLMFHEAAGASNYTGLTHAYQSSIDLSSHLKLQRAILVGQIDTKVTKLRLNGELADEQYDKTNTILRLILPVDFEVKKRR